MPNQELSGVTGGRGVPKLMSVPLSRLIKGPFQPRLGAIVKRDVLELMQSMQSVGQTTPIAVSVGPGDSLHVHQGERRWRSAEFLGWESLQAMVYETLPELEARALALADNLGREDLSAWEQALALAGYCKAADTGIEQAAERLGVSRATAYRLNAILSVSESLKAILEQSPIAARPAELLMRVDAKSSRKAVGLAKRFLEGKASTKDLEAAMKGLRSKPPRVAAVRREVEWKTDEHHVDLRIRLPVAGCGDDQRQNILQVVRKLFSAVGIDPAALLASPVSTGD